MTKTVLSLQLVMNGTIDELLISQTPLLEKLVKSEPMNVANPIVLRI